MTPICSIILPSFKRIGRLLKCIASINESCDHPELIEFCVRLQTNDPYTLENLPVLFKAAPTARFVIGHPYGGYRDNHLHFRDAYQIALGEWTWLMNDDCTVSGKGWDTRLRLRDHRERAFLTPLIHKLGASTYEKDEDCGAILVPRAFIPPEIAMPPDRSIRNQLRLRGFSHDFLDVTFHHDRDNDQALKEHSGDHDSALYTP